MEDRFLRMTYAVSEIKQSLNGTGVPLAPDQTKFELLKSALLGILDLLEPENVEIDFKRLTPDAIIPTPGKYQGDAGLDVYTTQSTTLQPGDIITLSTGIASQFPRGFVVLLFDRSGLGSHGISKLAGVIDPGYRHEWKVTLANHGRLPREIAAGDKVVQALILRRPDVTIGEVAELEPSERGEKGHGSTGR